MRRILTGLILIVCIGTLTSSPAQAWGKIGHRVTGYIADAHLSDEARARVKAILGSEDLAEASTWPDFMRASPEAFWQETSVTWHWVTIPVGKTYDEVGAPPEGDGISALAYFRDILLDESSSLEQQQIALRFIVHIVGDLHQPLHAGNGTDAGGNRFPVLFFGQMTNLHSVWDSKIIDNEQLSYTELGDWLLRRLDADTMERLQETNPSVWVDESAAIRDGIYPDADGDRDIRWAYIFEHRATVRKRLSHAGIRIAAYLNELFAETP
ncbi:MAG: S1/P1 nuclease [Pseudomonadota bacterium]